MAAEAARVLDYEYEYDSRDYYGTAAPAAEPYYEEPAPQQVEIPGARELPRIRERAKTRTVQSAPAVSVFAVFGSVLAGILMMLVVLAQINFSEISKETADLNEQLVKLTEQERALKIEFESVIDMKEIERYARDTLGMSRPDADQTAIVRSTQIDNAEILNSGGENAKPGGIGLFIASLLEYFK